MDDTRIDQFTLDALRDTEAFKAIWKKLVPTCPLCDAKMKSIDHWEMSEGWVITGFGCKCYRPLLLGVVIRMHPNLLVDMSRTPEGVMRDMWRAAEFTLPINARLDLAADLLPYEQRTQSSFVKAAHVYPSSPVCILDHGLRPEMLERGTIGLNAMLGALAPFMEWWVKGLNCGWITKPSVTFTPTLRQPGFPAMGDADDSLRDMEDYIRHFKKMVGQNYAPGT